MSDLCRDNRRPWLAFARTNVANFAIAFATNMIRPLTGWTDQRDPAERPKQKENNEGNENREQFNTGAHPGMGLLFAEGTMDSFWVSELYTGRIHQGQMST
jgi:hypothetical protein